MLAASRQSLVMCCDAAELVCLNGNAHTQTHSHTPAKTDGVTIRRSDGLGLVVPSESPSIPARSSSSQHNHHQHGSILVGVWLLCKSSRHTRHDAAALSHQTWPKTQLRRLTRRQIAHQGLTRCVVQGCRGTRATGAVPQPPENTHPAGSSSSRRVCVLLAARFAGG